MAQTDDEYEESEDDDEELDLEEVILGDVWVVWNLIWDEVAQERQREGLVWRKERVFLWLICVATLWNQQLFQTRVLGGGQVARTILGVVSLMK